MERWKINLGNVKRLASPKAKLYRLVTDEMLRNTIQRYLEDDGVPLPSGSGWNFWLDKDIHRRPREFAARCGDPPSTGPEDMKQPWNYFVIVSLPFLRIQPRVAVASDFLHESRMQERIK